jgi:hypothetical protein
LHSSSFSSYLSSSSVVSPSFVRLVSPSFVRLLVSPSFVRRLVSPASPLRFPLPSPARFPLLCRFVRRHFSPPFAVVVALPGVRVVVRVVVGGIPVLILHWVHVVVAGVSVVILRGVRVVGAGVRIVIVAGVRVVVVAVATRHCGVEGPWLGYFSSLAGSKRERQEKRKQATTNVACFMTHLLLVDFPLLRVNSPHLVVVVGSSPRRRRFAPHIRCFGVLFQPDCEA